MPESALLSLPEDVLCSRTIPDCRVLMMARTCRSMFRTLVTRRAPIHVAVRKQAMTDSRLANAFASGMHDLQALFRITRFDCIGVLNGTRTRCVELKLCEFEELTFMHLRHLRMHRNQLREAHLMHLLHILTYSKDLRSFEFTQQSLMSRHMLALADAISCFSKLEVLNLQDNFFIFDALAVVLDGVQSSRLTTLKLSSNRCEDDTTTSQLCRVIRCSCNSLKVLDLSFMRLRNTALESLTGAIGACVLLETLDLSRNHLHCGCLMEVLHKTSSCRHLQSFDWSGNRLGSAGTFVLAHHITTNEVFRSAIRVLKLRSCDVYNGMQQLTHALTMCTRLETLDISCNSVLAHEVVPLFTHTPIRSLDISDNYISDLGMRALLRLAMQSRTLLQLQVFGNHLTKHSVAMLQRMKKARRMDITVPRVFCPCNACQSE